jgi:hypothetical protein
VASADQTGSISQGITGDAVAHAPQVSAIDQSGDPTGGTAPADAATSTTADPNGALDGPLLNVDVNLDGNLNLAAPIDGAVAAQANVAAPIDASAAANIGSVDSVASAVSHQDVVIDQAIDGNASATADQQSSITQ